ncbi:hypothetical protein GLYMA_03G170700v4 [Glycine max]|uniref:Uncharacterized protein n=1 Tax=Glycine max TaxID=3847 RepID=A0A0R0KSW3_SOYBN|nr:hypothetical protein JHK86_007734 [Glycine max]KAH1070453.1 hypothetical protein GYH30_007500 [Glycine max]KRH67525.1 hypothetical protein GLYMA_03G170700v4 [Glycine max]
MVGASLKKDLRVSRVVSGGSLNVFLFLLIGVISQSTLGERNTTGSWMLRSRRMNRSRKGIY